MGRKVNTCVYLNREIVEAARRLGLNVSRVAGNALAEAVGRLAGTERAAGLGGGSLNYVEGRGRDLNPGARLHRPGGPGTDTALLGFFDFCRVDLSLAEATAKEYRRKMRRFLAAVGRPPEAVTAEDVRGFLKPLAGGSANTYGNALKPLKAFFRDYLRRPDVVASFKFRKIALRPVVIPSRAELRRFYDALRTPIARALFLMYASTGLRKMELLTLTEGDVDWARRMIVPNGHSGNTKRSWVTFFSAEAERALRAYLATRTDGSPKLFRISPHNFIALWRQAGRASGVRVTPQVLREWFCDELGRLGVPDRYVDAFCGRVPNSVLAKRYSGYAPEKLAGIYGSARLQVIRQ
jgi:integrase